MFNCTSNPTFNSVFRKIWNHSPIPFPEYSNTRIMMMPVRLGSLAGIPAHYHTLVESLYSVMETRFNGEIGYLTIDEKELQPGDTLRRSGLHVDGYYHGNCGAWGGGGFPPSGGGSWGSVGNGMLTISSTPHCKAYLGVFDGTPKDEGECDHLQPPSDGEVFEAGHIYWVDGACVHQSMPVTEVTKRQFVRLSMPSNGPWFEGYTENPSGIKPSNEILPRRSFMDNTPNVFKTFSEWSYYHSVVLGHTLKSVKNDKQQNIEWHDTVTGEIWYINAEHPQ